MPRCCFFYWIPAYLNLYEVAIISAGMGKIAVNTRNWTMNCVSCRHHAHEITRMLNGRPLERIHHDNYLVPNQKTSDLVPEEWSD